MRGQINSRITAASRKRAKQICPECGQDVHSADCPYYDRNR